METAISPVMIHPSHLHHSQTKEQMMNIAIHGKKKLLSLENYLAFFHSRDHQTINVGHLLQIISIHGFKQPKRRKTIEEALGVMELINPARSTLNDNISSKSFITVHEVIKDLRALNWQECSITSIRTFNSLHYADPAPIPSKTTTAKKPAKRNPKKRSKLIKILMATPTPSHTPLSHSENGSGSSKSGGGGGGGSGSASCSSLTPKRSKLPTPLASSGNNGSGPSESGSGSGSSTLMGASGANGAGNPVGAASKKRRNGARNPVGAASKKRRSIKRVYLGEAAAATQPDV